MKAYEFVTIVDGGEAASLVLNRSPLNIMNIAMLEEINAALEELQKLPNAKVFLIKAKGKAFSAGVDVADHTAEKIEDMMRELHRMFELLHGFRLPTIAVVDGPALGGGCELALFCDLVIASARATFGQPEVKVGVFPPIATAILPRLVGRNRTLDLLMSGETISAAEAERIGMINKKFPVEDFAKHVSEFVGKLTVHSKVVLEMTKRAVDGGLYRPCMEAMQRGEELYMREMMNTEDAHEGLKAFLEKRQPVWKNR
ncbi:MAG: enoyl-CoA hydratase/isomerase family protein [Bacteroidota bacterium]